MIVYWGAASVFCKLHVEKGDKTCARNAFHFNKFNVRVEPETFVKLNANMPLIKAYVLLGGPHVRRSADVRTIPFRTCVIRR